MLDELAKDAPFYRESGGGATFSGGEPLQQPEFLRELLGACRGEKISTVVDTSGQAPYSAFASILPLIDLFLFDLKIVDDTRHLSLTGASNRLLLANLQMLSRAGAPLLVRLPLVPGCNDAVADLEEAADFCAALPKRHPLHLLPYHRGYTGKLERQGRDTALPAIQPPTMADVERAADIFRARDLNVTIGG
ncbi:MAG: radical SAM protein [Chloroflexi bacterium]|nr:radical SAM protein [Chloroflexota bacterium]